MTSQSRQPVLFLGHGTPLNVIDDNHYTRGWAALGARLSAPSAILAISAHWYVEATAVTMMANPPTIYDFGYRNLFHIKYPAPGSPALARRVAELLSPTPVFGDEGWGLDHGTWSVLTKLFPKADIPVVQLSIDFRRAPDFHFDLGARLRKLRDEKVLIVASGNIVHNLRLVVRDGVSAPFPWATRFDEIIKEKISGRNWASLIDYQRLPDAALAAPTPDHYLPLLYAAGASDENDAITFPIEGIDRGTMSMRSVAFGL